MVISKDREEICNCYVYMYIGCYSRELLEIGGGD